MNQHPYNLYSFCEGSLIAHDGCDSLEELKTTFIDAYSHYLGRKPRKNTIENFMSNMKITARNKISYHFTY